MRFDAAMAWCVPRVFVYRIMRQLQLLTRKNLSQVQKHTRPLHPALQISSLAALRVFSRAELPSVLFGEFVIQWTEEELCAHLKKSSFDDPAVDRRFQWLVEILLEYDQHEVDMPWVVRLFVRGCSVCVCVFVGMAQCCSHARLQRRSFLSFATGSNNLPLGGLQALGKMQIKISGETMMAYPNARSCFSQVYLPKFIRVRNVARRWLRTPDRQPLPAGAVPQGTQVETNVYFQGAIEQGIMDASKGWTRFCVKMRMRRTT